MSKVDLSALVNGFSGKLGNGVLRRRGNRTYLSQKPREKRREPSPAQLAHRLRFQAAIAYGRVVFQDPVARAYYERITGRSEYMTPYNMAVTDYLKAPVISRLVTDKYLGDIGDVLLVHATDRCGITAVEVTITSAGGIVLEQGAAIVPAGQVTWQYTATVANGTLTGTTIKVVAKDRPGNETVLNVVL